ncbi:hypothetical protein PsorP6_007206 [Peronosclerospora sorghi]|uniref:Uncharacterized protein n=1 Tax=Peronosclerospora sorghi TaxID=230839 RepID=A0ACC0W6Z7_9STRA|nr:hypothetical protein PsorP6_007206 [Peronosclerospora sorghi]
MFSATMPVEVERLATTFLRHPSIVKIGNDNSGKNKRIDQRVLFMNPRKKRLKLGEILQDILSAHSVPVPRSRKKRSVEQQCSPSIASSYSSVFNSPCRMPLNSVSYRTTPRFFRDGLARSGFMASRSGVPDGKFVISKSAADRGGMILPYLSARCR